MKKLFALLLSAVMLLGNIGCVSTSAPSDPLTEAQRIDKLALVLKSTVSGVVTLAADDRKQSTREQILAARDAIEFLIQEDTVEPKHIVSAIIPLLENAKPEVRLAVVTALGILEGYYGDFVIGKVNGNANAKKFLKSVVDGIDLGLAAAPPVVP